MSAADTEPAWRRATAGERRFAVALGIAAAAVLQALLPARFSLLPSGVVVTLEVLAFIATAAVNPVRLEREHPVGRYGSLGLLSIIIIANAGSAGLLIGRLVQGTAGRSATPLLLSGASIYVTNVIAFAYAYWAFDRGGPVARGRAVRRHPDLLVPQMANPDMADPDWEPWFLDYLYVSSTNALAFSPTDTLPLARWAKVLMLAQSLISIVTVALVVARAVNILPG